jgi:hypothetical protein
MIATNVDTEEYGKMFPRVNHIFNSSAFNELNKDKAERVEYIVFQKEGKNKMGIIGGIKNKTFCSPFSAPFGGLYCENEPDITNIEEAYNSLEAYLVNKGVDAIRITLPPSIYNESLMSVLYNVSFREGYSISMIDLNFQFELDKFNDDYLQKVAKYNARKNYNLGAKNGLGIEKVRGEEKIKLAYNIIETNRRQRGFPLKMSLENIKKTIKVVPADFFIVYSTEGTPIASAMVYSVTDKIAQVVYWGHNVEHSALKPINYLSYKLFEYYKQAGFEYLDIGPSTDAGVPNYGLIEFKQSIGCSISPKLTFEKKLAK